MRGKAKKSKLRAKILILIFGLFERYTRGAVYTFILMILGVAISITLLSVITFGAILSKFSFGSSVSPILPQEFIISLIGFVVLFIAIPLAIGGKNGR